MRNVYLCMLFLSPFPIEFGILMTILWISGGFSFFFDITHEIYCYIPLLIGISMFIIGSFGTYYKKNAP